MSLEMTEDEAFVVAWANRCEGAILRATEEELDQAALHLQSELKAETGVEQTFDVLRGLLDDFCFMFQRVAKEDADRVLMRWVHDNLSPDPSTIDMERGLELCHAAYPGDTDDQQRAFLDTTFRTRIKWAEQGFCACEDLWTSTPCPWCNYREAAK